ncbi:hypothetical protein Sjap_025168 [Stephania japonica]|uniref:glucan endo-1,3-beta-D-glucosidase n=1 Tax=Stephania japonica TaxID=461633 RepID=A0AAP0E4P4_9MAGN
MCFHSLRLFRRFEMGFSPINKWFPFDLALSHLLLLLLLMFALFFKISDAEGWIGVNYGRIANDLPSAVKVVQLLKSQGINRVKLYDTDPSVLKALANSNIKVTVALPNELLSSVAKKPQFASTWVSKNILPYHPTTQIESIAVGNEVFVDPQNTTLFLVPAMRNLQSSLTKYNLASSIKLSTPIALSALQSSYPPSSGAFKSALVEPVIKPLLDFLNETNSPLFVNAYPFFAYSANSDVISLDYALFRNNAGNVDPSNGLRYLNLLDAQIDAVYAALTRLNYGNVKVVVTETGWPSKGDENEIGAAPENAEGYNGNLVKRVLNNGGGNGTPLRPESGLNVYLFALFNENQKPGPTSERNYGLFYPSEEKVYDVPFTAEAVKGWTGGKAQKPPPVRNGGGGGGGGVTAAAAGQTWCVADEKMRKERLQEGLDYACGEGGADCRPIQEGATCWNPNTVHAHASYAFNSYYQKKGRAVGSCYFGGAAYVVTQPPMEATWVPNGAHARECHGWDKKGDRPSPQP